MKQLRGFYSTVEARKIASCISRPDLVTERNAALFSEGYKRPHERRSVLLSRVPADNRVHFYRPINHGDGTYSCGSCYAVLSPERIAELRKEKQLDLWLDVQRDSGVIIDVRG